MSAMDTLAAGYGDAGQLDKALSLHQETLRLTRAKLGPKHPGTLNSMNNVAAHIGDCVSSTSPFPCSRRRYAFAKSSWGTIILKHSASWLIWARIISMPVGWTRPC